MKMTDRGAEKVSVYIQSARWGPLDIFLDNEIVMIGLKKWKL